MTARVGSCLNPLDVHSEVQQRNVAHLYGESGGFGEARLVERNVASECGFNGETLAARDLIVDEHLKLAVYEPADVTRNADIRAAVQFRATIVSIE